MNKTELQQELDIKKWLDSEANGADTCGTYAYCANCDKQDATPCASAQIATETVVAPKAKAPAKKKAPAKAKAEPKAKAPTKAKAEPKAKAPAKAKTPAKAKVAK